MPDSSNRVWSWTSRWRSAERIEISRPRFDSGSCFFRTVHRCSRRAGSTSGRDSSSRATAREGSACPDCARARRRRACDREAHDGPGAGQLRPRRGAAASCHVDALAAPPPQALRSVFESHRTVDSASRSGTLVRGPLRRLEKGVPRAPSDRDARRSCHPGRLLDRPGSRRLVSGGYASFGSTSRSRTRRPAAAGPEGHSRPAFGGCRSRCFGPWW